MHKMLNPKTRLADEKKAAEAKKSEKPVAAHEDRSASAKTSKGA